MKNSKNTNFSVAYIKGTCRYTSAFLYIYQFDFVFSDADASNSIIGVEKDIMIFEYNIRN